MESKNQSFEFLENDTRFRFISVLGNSRRKKVTLRVFFLTAIFLLIFSLTTGKKNAKVVCYFGSWAVYRPGSASFDVSDIDPKLCTHAIYAFVGIKPDGSVRILDRNRDIDKGGFRKFTDLKLKNPKLKMMVAVGGWNEGSEKFSSISNNSSLRTKFVNEAYEFVTRYKFDGLDVDWEYPTLYGGAPADKINFALLIKELRNKFGNKLLLSAAVSPAFTMTSGVYNPKELSMHLDFINLMSYDYHGSWNKKAGANAPLYSASIDPTELKDSNVNASVTAWLKAGVSANKLILGLGLYGTSFTLQDPSKAGIGDPVTGPGVKGPYAQQAGILTFKEICEKLQEGGWNINMHPEQKIPYASKGDQWVGYENVASIKEKCVYIKTNKLGGGMVWSMDQDDFRGSCGEGRNPLLSAINKALK